MAKEIVLGCKAKDIVTGYIGITTARTEYLNGCVQYKLTTKVTEKDEVNIYWVDVERLVYKGKGVQGLVDSSPSGGGKRDHSN